MQGNVYDIIPGLLFLSYCNAWHTNLDVCSLYFGSVFIGCVNFQVSRIFDVNSSLEKRLDIMVVFYDFVFPHDLQHQQRPKLFLVSVVYHIFGAYFSVALVCSRFCWLQSDMQHKFPINDRPASVLNFQFSLGAILSKHSAWQMKHHITLLASISAEILFFFKSTWLHVE